MSVEDAERHHKRLQVIAKSWIDLKQELASRKDDATTWPSHMAPVQSFVVAHGDYGLKYSFPRLMAKQMTAAALEACRDDLVANVRWGLDHNLITEAVAREFLSIVKEQD